MNPCLFVETGILAFVIKVLIARRIGSAGTNARRAITPRIGLDTRFLIFDCLL